MAIGDAVAALLGTATTSRQPSSGVEEQISMIAKDSETDRISTTDGTNNVEWFAAATSTQQPQGSSAATRNMPFNTACMLTNTIYITKQGTTDRVYIGGVQTNA